MELQPVLGAAWVTLMGRGWGYAHVCTHMSVHTCSHAGAEALRSGRVFGQRDIAISGYEVDHGMFRRPGSF